MTQAWTPDWDDDLREEEAIAEHRDEVLYGKVVKNLKDAGCEVTELQDSILVKPPGWPSIGKGPITL